MNGYECFFYSSKQSVILPDYGNHPRIRLGFCDACMSMVVTVEYLR